MGLAEKIYNFGLVFGGNAVIRKRLDVIRTKSDQNATKLAELEEEYNEFLRSTEVERAQIARELEIIKMLEELERNKRSRESTRCNIASKRQRCIEYVKEFCSDESSFLNDMQEILKEEFDEEAIGREFEIQNPVAEEPTVEESVVEEPVAEESVVEELAAEEPVAEEPVVEELAAEEPTVEESVEEELAAEEPVAEEPTAEEPVVEESSITNPLVCWKVKPSLNLRKYAKEIVRIHTALDKVMEDQFMAEIHSSAEARNKLESAQRGLQRDKETVSNNRERLETLGGDISASVREDKKQEFVLRKKEEYEEGLNAKLMRLGEEAFEAYKKQNGIEGSRSEGIVMKDVTDSLKKYQEEMAEIDRHIEEIGNSELIGDTQKEIINSQMSQLKAKILGTIMAYTISIRKTDVPVIAIGNKEYQFSQILREIPGFCFDPKRGYRTVNAKDKRTIAETVNTNMMSWIRKGAVTCESLYGTYQVNDEGQYQGISPEGVEALINHVCGTDLVVSEYAKHDAERMWRRLEFNEKPKSPIPTRKDIYAHIPEITVELRSRRNEEIR